ncbi:MULTISPECIES: GntR family transcriptional regulator [unclassified Nocardioides]|uniref:GntR family transcriptional regulator n=1 Tax=unclassified Nocardioides TaxID=2615069 RepID=UPI0036242A6B
MSVTSNRLPQVGTGSLTERTTSVLLDAILNGTFPDNRLPTEPLLASQLGVSRTTVRGALMTLERLGVIGRTPGRGTIVRRHVGRQAIILQRLIGFRGLLEETHDVVEVEQRYWLEARPTDRAVEILGVKPDATMIRTAKTMTADGAPAIFISDEIPLQYCDPADQLRLRAGEGLDVADSIFEFSRSWPHGSIEHTVIELVPSLVTEPDEHLGLPLGSPFLRLWESHHNLDGRALALSEALVNDQYVRFHVVRH